MKKILLCLFCFGYIALNAQDRYDYTWLFGYQPEPGFPHPKLGGSRLDFNLMPPDTSRFVLPLSFRAISMISDKTTGQLLFYTNGCQIANRNHVIMENGDGLSPGDEHDEYCQSGYPLGQCVLTLPYPGFDKKYVLIHYQFNDSIDQTFNLLYTTVNMDTPDGLGKVEEKNQPLLSTEPISDMLTAVRHGNGRDWWIVVPRCLSNKIYLFLLTPDGFQGPFIHSIGPEWDYHFYQGQAVFSPNGTKYIRASPWNGLHITDFDRCTGTFTNAKYISLANNINVCGVAVSPNSRKLYLSTGSKLWQYDLTVPNIALSAALVGTYDGYQSPFSATFFQPMLAPDGKIYMTCTNGDDVLHVIHHPDEVYDECDFEQHGLRLPTYHAFMVPNFPHFRLYDMADSPCDTLGINGPVVGTAETPESIESGDLRVQPNPATDEVLIFNDLQKDDGRWTLYNAAGVMVQSGNWEGAAKSLRLSVGSMPNGLYFFALTSGTGKTTSVKLAVAH